MSYDNITNYDGDQSSVEFSYVVINKGIGPAIIDSVTYLLNDTPIKGWTLDKELSKIYPKAKITRISNHTLDNSVLAPGNMHKVISIRIESKDQNKINVEGILISFEYYLDFCYCSIFGKCWKFTGPDMIAPSTECVNRENIR